MFDKVIIYILLNKLVWFEICLFQSRIISQNIQYLRDKTIYRKNKNKVFLKRYLTREFDKKKVYF